MNTIYIVRCQQTSPRIDTIVFSSPERSECIKFFNESEYKECYIEKWRGTVVLVRNVLIK